MFALPQGLDHPVRDYFVMHLATIRYCIYYKKIIAINKLPWNELQLFYYLRRK